jgi:hypothetical protein
LLGLGSSILNRFLKVVLLILQLSNALRQVPVHVMITDGMAVIEQIMEFRAATVLTLNAEKTFLQFIHNHQAYSWYSVLVVIPN